MCSAELNQDKEAKKQAKRMPYEAPKVVYEGVISTRAGSPTGSPPIDGDAVDPADLFNNG